jgi:2-keto-4-pentenoate hydratase/2-oxohepta-3-ene-1,7-dioic acid hydratase in catechol pathway
MKIICIGRNYVAHAAELNNVVPTEPVIFLKPATALLLNNEDFYYPEFSKDIHYECELVLRIGKTGKYIAKEFAYKYINGFTLGIDFTARDLQDNQKSKGLPWEIAKAFDNSAVVGKIHEIVNLNVLEPIVFEFYKNNELVQNGNTSLMIFTIADIISYTSQFFKLQAGDLIFTGTPAGVGSIKINDLLIGKINNEELVRCAIK